VESLKGGSPGMGKLLSLRRKHGGGSCFSKPSEFREN
jgi:hypothetical protein